MSIELDDTLMRNDELVHSAIDNETVMMSLEQDEYYGLDEIATHIWTLLEQPQSAGQILESLESEYDATREQIQADVLPFLHEMVQNKILLIQ